MESTQSISCEDFFKNTDKLPIFQGQGNLLRWLGKDLTAAIIASLKELGAANSPVVKGEVSSKAHIEGPVFIAEGTVVEPFSFIKGPCFIGPDCQVRHGAYIRGSVYCQGGNVVGHSTEVKGSVFLTKAKAAHFAYVGDSILGRAVNLGAGTKLANFKFDGSEVCFRHPEGSKKTGSGLRKFGAILGDEAQTGCNAVLDPGSLLLPGTAVLACRYFRGTLREGWFNG